MIRGTSHDQDARFKDKTKKMLLESTWPDKYDTKIDLSKVDFQILKNWIEKRTTQLMGYEDDIVSGTALSLLQQSLNKQQKPNAKKIHVSLSGFLTNHTLTFVSQLIDWLDQAQKSKSGIPKIMLDQKKLQEISSKKKLKEINQRKDKMKDYKFDIIKGHIGRQKQPSLQKKRKERKEQKRRSHQKSGKKQKKRRRSQSRDKKSKRREVQYKQQKDRDDHQNKKKDKRRHRKSYSRSESDQRSRNQSRSRSAQKKQNRRKNRHRDKSSSSEPKKLKSRNRTGNDEEESNTGKRKSIAKSQSSQVISSSSQN